MIGRPERFLSTLKETLLIMVMFYDFLSVIGAWIFGNIAETTRAYFTSDMLRCFSCVNHEIARLRLHCIATYVTLCDFGTWPAPGSCD